MKKIIFTIAILWIIPWNSYAYTITETTAYFNENGFLGIPCVLVPNVSNSNYWVSGIGTSTYPLLMDIVQSNVSGYGPLDSQDYCNGLTNAQTFANSVMSGEPAGIYYYFNGYYTSISPADVDYYYIWFEWDGSTITDFHYGPTETEIYYLDPSGRETVASSTSNTFYADLYLAEKDYQSGEYIELKYVRQQDLQAAVANQDLLWTTLTLNDTITYGYNFLSTTTDSLGMDGVYYLKATLKKPTNWWQTTLNWINPFTTTEYGIITSTTTTFVYGGKTAFDELIEDTQEVFNFDLASSTATENIKEACKLDTNWNIKDCIKSLFVPNWPEIYPKMTDLKNGILNSFPIGYFSEFVTIMSTSTAGTLTVIDATLPSPLGLGSGHHIHLDLTGVLDPILNATTTIFNNESANDTRSLYEITVYYWKILVYVGAMLYVLTRIVGAGLMPRYSNSVTEGYIETVNKKGEVSRNYVNRRSRTKNFK